MVRSFGLRYRALVSASLLVSALFAVSAQNSGAAHRMVVAQRSEPRTFNPVLAVDDPSRVVLGLTGAALVRLNPETRTVEGVLAESWKVIADGSEVSVRLRPGLQFSDGSPLTAHDVAFTFQIHADPKVASPLLDSLQVAGRPVSTTVLSDRDVRFRFGAPYALAERLLAGVAILPRKLLDTPYREGRLPQVWALNTPPAEIVSSGPFRLKTFQPAIRLILERNPYYAVKDRDGRQLPLLREIEFVFTATEDSQVTRVAAGNADLVVSLGPSGFAALAASPAPPRLLDLGPGLDYTFLLFNLNPGSVARPWLRSLEFRNAIAAAVDREAIAKLVYRGRATPLWGYVTPSRKPWTDESLPKPKRSLDHARQLLGQAGFRWKDAALTTASGETVAFTMIVSSSNPAYLQTAAIIEEDLKPLGIRVQIVPLEFRSLVDRVVNSHDFDTAIMALRPGDADPVADMNVLLSSGATHLWNLSGKPKAWEQRIDALMRQQLETRDPARRRVLFNQVQRLLVSQMPFISLVSPNILAAAHPGLENLRGGVAGQPLLWNAEEIRWTGAASAATR